MVWLTRYATPSTRRASWVIWSFAFRMRMRCSSVSGAWCIIHALVMGAQVQHHIRCTFDRHHVPAGFMLVEGREIIRCRFSDLMHCDHALAFRIERHFLDAWVGMVERSGQRPGFGCCHHQCPFRRVTGHPVGLLLIARAGDGQLGIIVQCSHPQGSPHSRVFVQVPLAYHPHGTLPSACVPCR